MSRWLTQTLACLALLVTVLAAPARAQPALLIASEAADPPFSTRALGGRLGGFEIDLAKAMCAAMEATCTFTAVERAALIPGLLAHRYDAVMSSVADTPALRRLVAFSKPYYRLPAAFAARKAAHLAAITPAALEGRRVGAEADTDYAAYLLQHYAPAGVIVKLYATAPEAALDLSYGHLDAVLGNKVALLEWMGKDPAGACCAFVGDDLRDPAAFGSGVGVVLRPDDEALRRRFDDALATVIADGRYARIADKYFPFSIY